MPRKKKNPPSDELMQSSGQAMRELGPCNSTTEIADYLGESKEQVRAAITMMVDSGSVIKTGKKRWVRYTDQSMADQIPEAAPKSKAKPDSAPKKPKAEPADNAEPEHDVADVGPEVVFADVHALLEHSLPKLDANTEYEPYTFGKAVIEQAPQPPDNITHYDVMKELPSLVRRGVMKAFKVYRDGWRFYYRRNGTDAEILSILKSSPQTDNS
jgi:hypothetical protein